MNNKKGFTLIELLAVIVILAIIALIATPIILNMINDARKSAAVDSAYGYIEAIDYNNAMSQLNGKYKKIESGEVTSFNNKVNVKGTKPTSGTIEVDASGRVIKATLVINGYEVKYEDGEATVEGKVTDNENKEEKEEQPENQQPEEVVTGPTSEDPDKNTTKGLLKIVYLDPTDLTKTCTSEDAANNVNSNGTPTEITTGCMKWYAYKDDGTNYLMILDHNITGTLAWSHSISDKPGVMTDAANFLNNKTSSWDSKLSLSETIDNFDYTGYKARLITADEVAEITGANTSLKWASNLTYTYDTPEIGTTVSDYYLDGLNGTDTTWKTKVASLTTKSKYAWLYDYTAYSTSDGCIDYGCNISDRNYYNYYAYGEVSSTEKIAGYWTSTMTTESNGNSTQAYRVSERGNLQARYVGNIHDAGIRPVIKVQKSLIRE